MIKEKDLGRVTRINGLGDVVERITMATGIKAIVESINDGKECKPCAERKKKLNDMFPLNFKL